MEKDNMKIEVHGFDNPQDFQKALKEHSEIMRKVNEKFADRPQDEFGNLIITEDIEKYIKELKNGR
jgi:TATA-box binding protein (TBP) (component of TFIID and TFIIIB)